MTDRLLLTPREAAALLGIGRSKLYLLLKSGDLDPSTSAPAGASRATPCSP
jgi:predicted DNA-binding transcriptional regulator AlpA